MITASERRSLNDDDHLSKCNTMRMSPSQYEIKCNENILKVTPKSRSTSIAKRTRGQSLAMDINIEEVEVALKGMREREREREGGR